MLKHLVILLCFTAAACGGNLDASHGTWSADGFSFSVAKVKVGHRQHQSAEGFKISWRH